MMSGSRNLKLRRVVLLGPSLRQAELSWLSKKIRSLRPQGSDIWMGVDGGIELARKLRRLLHVAIGDWDSARPQEARDLARTGSAVVTLPRSKNESDLAAALSLVEVLPVSELILLGFTGGRPDHQLSNLLEISRFAASRRAPKKIAAFGPEAEYHFLTRRQSPVRLSAKRGALVSVFAVHGAAKGVSMNGFAYNLRNETLRPSSRGLSNVAQRAGTEIRITGAGALVVISPKGRHAR